MRESKDKQSGAGINPPVDSLQLRVEYHPQSDGTDAKTPNDFVTVDSARACDDFLFRRRKSY
jgi:hypothetical protein